MATATFTVPRPARVDQIAHAPYTTLIEYDSERHNEARCSLGFARKAGLTHQVEEEFDHLEISAPLARASSDYARRAADLARAISGRHALDRWLTRAVEKITTAVERLKIFDLFTIQNDRTVTVETWHRGEKVIATTYPNALVNSAARVLIETIKEIELHAALIAAWVLKHPEADAPRDSEDTRDAGDRAYDRERAEALARDTLARIALSDGFVAAFVTAAPRRETMNANKFRAEVSVLAAALYDWHAGRITRDEFRRRAGVIANAAEIERIELIGKFEYEGQDALRTRVAFAYSRPSRAI